MNLCFLFVIFLSVAGDAPNNSFDWNGPMLFAEGEAQGAGDDGDVLGGTITRYEMLRRSLLGWKRPHQSMGKFFADTICRSFAIGSLALDDAEPVAGTADGAKGIHPSPVDSLTK